MNGTAIFSIWKHKIKSSEVVQKFIDYTMKLTIYVNKATIFRMQYARKPMNKPGPCRESNRNDRMSKNYFEKRRKLQSLCGQTHAIAIAMQNYWMQIKRGNGITSNNNQGFSRLLGVKLVDRILWQAINCNKWGVRFCVRRDTREQRTATSFDAIEETEGDWASRKRLQAYS